MLATGLGEPPSLVAAGFGVIAPERRGHGRIPDVAGPLTYQAMAAGTVAFLDAVVSGPAHLVGWSDGAVVAVLVAMQRPDLAERIVLIGRYLNSGGWMPNAFLDQPDLLNALIIGFLRGDVPGASPW